MTLHGWTQEQWSEAVAAFARSRGFTPLPRLANCIEVWAWWKLHRGLEPGDRRLLLVEREWPRRTRPLRDFLMCDDPKELARMRAELDAQPPAAEKNVVWAALLFVDALNSMFDVSGPDEMAGRLIKGER